MNPDIKYILIGVTIYLGFMLIMLGILGLRIYILSLISKPIKPNSFLWKIREYDKRRNDRNGIKRIGN
jgi:hypothetical protein